MNDISRYVCIPYQHRDDAIMYVKIHESQALTEGVKFQLEASENKDVPFFFFFHLRSQIPLTSIHGPPKLNLLEGYFRVFILLCWNL